jgi:DNA-binding NtrC family response regulator
MVAAARDTIDLVLMDVVMPRMGGPEAYRAMQAMRPTLPVVFASGYGGREPPSALSIDSARILLDKPYDPDQLLRAVRQALDHHNGTPSA